MFIFEILPSQINKFKPKLINYDKVDKRREQRHLIKFECAKMFPRLK